MKSWLSLLGLYRYDQTIFDEFVVPAEVVKADLIQNLLLETAELEIIYPEPEIMRQIIGAWSRARLHVWERIALVLYKNYDPFINITRDEVRTIQTQKSNTQTNNLTRTQDITRTDNLTETDNRTQTNTVSAWDSSSFQNRDKTTNGGSLTNTGTVRDAGSVADKGTVSDNGNSTVTETLHIEGDSAITDAQDVARKEIELRSIYELDDYIINDFKNRFCLLVY